MGGNHMSLTRRRLLGSGTAIAVTGFLGARLRPAHAGVTPGRPFEGQEVNVLSVQASQFAAHEQRTAEFEELTKVDMAGGIRANKLDGVVIDDDEAKLTGKWTGGAGLKGFIGTQYQYGRTGDARFNFEIPGAGNWDVRMSWQPHENRSSKTKVQVIIDGEIAEETVVNQRKAGELKYGFHSLLKQDFTKGQKGSVVILTEGADGNVAIDAVQLLKSE